MFKGPKIKAMTGLFFIEMGDLLHGFDLLPPAQCGPEGPAVPEMPMATAAVCQNAD